MRQKFLVYSHGGTNLPVGILFGHHEIKIYGRNKNLKEAIQVAHDLTGIPSDKSKWTVHSKNKTYIHYTFNTQREIVETIRLMNVGFSKFYTVKEVTSFGRLYR